MNIIEIKNAIANGKFDSIFDSLYSDTAVARNRYISACESFEKFIPYQTK